MTNRTPYAHAQSVSLVQNTAQAITLTGSGGTLAYTVVSQPAHGALTGSVPNLTYTPAANFNGPDSFSFLVNNGTSNSSPATVSISIWAGQPVSCTWSSATSGNCSVAGNWASVAPAATGQVYYSLNFAPAGTYTVTHDLNNGFLLNQLNVTGALTLAGTNSLAFTANGTLLPQFNQNSSSMVTVNTPLSLTAMTSFGGTGGGEVDLASSISGTGGLTKANAGMLKIYGLTPNTYSGGTIVNSGTLHLGTMVSDISPLCANPVGTGSVTLNSGTIEFDRVTVTNALAINGGTLYSNNGWGSTWSGPITLNASVTVDAAWNLTLSGNISGAGGITKTGGNPLLLSGINSFSGANRITAGTLSCSKAAALGTGPIDISNGAIVALNFTGTRTIASLTFNAGSSLPPGTYGSTASPAINKTDSYFSGPGTVTVLPTTTTELSLTSGSTPSNSGTPLIFTSTVTGNSPTGNLAFYDGTSLLGTSTLNASYQATFTTNSLAIGPHSITAQYAGNATHATSTSAAMVIEITSMLPPAPSNLLAAPGSNHIGLTWTVSAAATSYCVKRSLTSGGTLTVIGNPSSASYDDLTAANGSTYYYVVSAINAAGESANSNQVSAIPAVQPSTTTLVSSPVDTGSYGTALTLTATVTAGATGTVTFKEGSTVLGIATLNSGTGTFSTSALAVGNHSITVTYSGDATFNGSVSAPIAYMVTAKTLTITGVTATSRFYDKTTAATLTGGTVSGGLVASETLTIIPGNGTFASPDAGTWPVTASGYSLGGPYIGNYVLSAQPSVPNATITQLPVVLAGSRSYDGTATASASDLTIQNNLDGSNLSLSGTATLAAKDAGTLGVLSNLVTPVQVQNATGSSGTGSVTSFNVNLATPPVSGDTLIAVISTRGTSTGRVSGITQTGTLWSRATQAANSSGTTTEIWYTSNVPAGLGSQITISQASLRSAAVVVEYKGILTGISLDQISTATGSSSAAVTGTSATTTQANELWISGIGIADGRRSLNGPYGNSFTVVASPKSGGTSSDAMIYALVKIVSTIGTASSGGTISTSDAWAGAIATFKVASTSTLALTGAAAVNYTLAGSTGSVTITPKTLTVTAVSSTKTYDGTCTAAGTPTYTPPLLAGDMATVLSQVFQTPDAGTGNKVIVPNISINDGNSGANYAVTLANCMTGTIEKASATVTLGDLVKTYDGSPKAASATTHPGGKTVNFTYEGSSTPPTDIGSYLVLATIADPNFSGTATGTLTIAAEPLAVWRSANFTAAEISTGLASDNMDADGDGLTNLAEYTLGTDPRSFSPQPLAIAAAAGNPFTLSFVALRATGDGYTGLTRRYTVECTADPVSPTSWQPITGYTDIVGNDQTVGITQPATDASRFYRLNVRVE